MMALIEAQKEMGGMGKASHPRSSRSGWWLVVITVGALLLITLGVRVHFIRSSSVSPDEGPVVEGAKDTAAVTKMRGACGRALRYQRCGSWGRGRNSGEAHGPLALAASVPQAADEVAHVRFDVADAWGALIRAPGSWQPS